MRRHALWVLALAMAACQGKPGTNPPRPTALASAASGAAALPTGPAASLAPGALPSAGAEALRRLEAGLPAHSLKGAIRMVVNPQSLVAQGGGVLSDYGAGILGNHAAGIVSNNGGGIVSNHGGGIVSNHGGGLVSDQGGALVGKTKIYQVAQAEAGASLANVLLAEAEVEVLDLQGRRLAGPDGQPLVAISNAQGQYAFQGGLPDEPLLFRVRLFQGGALVGLLPKDRALAEAFDLDTERSLSSQYLLDRVAPSRPGLLELVGAAALERVRAAIAASPKSVAGLLGAQPGYAATQQSELTGLLRQREACVDEAILAIERLVGQSNLGDGRLASEVALSSLKAIAPLPDGRLLIAEGVGRLREVGTDGKIRSLAGLGSQGPALGLVADMLALPDGSVLIAEYVNDRITRLTPPAAAGGAWRSEVVAGEGAALTVLRPLRLGLAPGGEVLVAEGRKPNGLGSRIHSLKLGTSPSQSLLPALPLPPGADGSTRFEIPGLAVGPDGTAYAAAYDLNSSGDNGRVWALAPGATAWQDQGIELVPSPAHVGLVAGEGGALWVANGGRHTVHHRPAGGAWAVVAGRLDDPGESGDGGPATAAKLLGPTGLWHDAQGRLWIADSGNAVVRRVGADGAIATVAGRSGGGAVGSLNGLPVNAPLGLAPDPQGRGVLVAEGGTSLIKRLNEGLAEVWAGRRRGFEGDGQARALAAFRSPAALSLDGKGGLLVADTANRRIRRIDAQGQVSTVVGAGVWGVPKLPSPAAQLPLKLVTGIVASPTGDRFWWCDTENHYVGTVLPDGTATVVAGTPSLQGGDGGDGGLASAAKLNLPAGLALGPDGTLYVGDMLNMRVRAISPDGRIRSVAGLPAVASFAALAGKPGGFSGEVEATAEALALPGALALSPDGRSLAIAELGTQHLGSVGWAGASIPSLPGLPQVGGRVLKLDLASGRLSTLAGRGSQVLASGEDQLLAPLALAFHPDGRLIAADTGANQIWALRLGPAACPAP